MLEEMTREKLAAMTSAELSLWVIRKMTQGAKAPLSEVRSELIAFSE
jgi:hypothetical protein